MATNSVGGQVRGFGAAAHGIAELSPGLVAFNLGYLGLAWLLIAGALTGFWLHPTWWTFILAFVIVSSRQQALLNCEHEAVHLKLLPRRGLNNFVGTYLCAAAVGSPFGAARDRHLSHHRLVGAPEDPDRELYTGDDKRTRRGLTGYFVRGLCGAYAGMVLMGPRAPRAAASGSSRRRDLVSLAVVQVGILVALTVAFAWWVYPVLWLAPLATLTALCHLIRSFVEHALTDSEIPEHGNRLVTIRSNLLERSLVSPYFMNYHAEHHLVPSVPAPRLHQLQRRLVDDGEAAPVLVRSSYGAALRDYARALPPR
jgi:fatty acid desaturase